MPSVDHRAIKLNPLEQIVVDVIGALTDLEMAVRTRAHQVTAQFCAGCRTDATSSDVKLTQSQKRKEREHVRFGQRRGTANQIIFVATKGRAGIMIDIVANETDLVIQTQILNGLEQDRVASAVVTKNIDE